MGRETALADTVPAARTLESTAIAEQAGEVAWSGVVVEGCSLRLAPG